MKFMTPMLVVQDIEKSKRFYMDVLGLEIIMDFGANVTFTGGVAIQDQKVWLEFIHKEQGSLHYGGHNAELYFEEDNFDEFLKKLAQYSAIEYVHPVQEHDWGQRAVRFYDPDMHIIEVGENLMFVCKRFLKNGLTAEEVVKRMGVPLTFVQNCME